jgi:hypothetical protein
VDFVPALLVAALTVCWRWKALAVTALVFGMLINVAISLTGYDDGLRERHPATWHRIAGFFGASTPEQALDVAATVRFPAAPRRRTEPLLTSGRPFAGNVVAVTWLDPQTIRVLSSKWGVSGESSPPLRIDPARSYELRIHYMPEQRRLTVSFDDEVVLTHEMALFPTEPSDVLIGANRISPEVFGRSFSGTIEVHSRLLAEQQADALTSP